MADVITKSSVVTAESPVIDLRKKITLIAPDDAKFHTPGEAVKISPTQRKKFEKLGYYEEGKKPQAKTPPPPPPDDKK